MIVSTEVDIEIERPAREIFDYLANGENMPEWIGQFKAAQKATEGPIRVGTTFRFRLDGDAATGPEELPADAPTLEWIAYDPPRYFEWRGSEVTRGPKTTVAPRGSFTLEEISDERTLVHGVWAPEVEGLPSIASPFFKRAYKKDRVQDCDRVKVLLEGAGSRSEARAGAGHSFSKIRTLVMTIWR